VRNVIFASAILAGVLLAPIMDGRDLSPALAEKAPTRIQDAPCGWFTSLYPGAWGTDHKILINLHSVIENASFGRGTYRLADGTDAYEYLQRKCGKE
jgi:hypothetical protein